jgi:zinc-ribbon domain
MHCPNCGSEAPMEQKFCRSCGFGLGKVARLIAEQATDEDLDSAFGSKEEPSKRFRQVWFPFFIIMFLTFCVFLIAPGGGKNFGGVVFIVLLLTMLAFGTYMEFGRKRPGVQQSPRPASSTNAPTTQKLQPPPEIEMNASVTEQTTANLAEKIEN